MIVILDNGHGENTAGKRSPDGIFREYSFAREIVKRISVALNRDGYSTHILVPENEDVSLSERVRRANAISKANKSQAVLISVHVNAAGNGQEWKTATGFSAHVSPNSSMSSKALATLLAENASALGLRVRRTTPAQQFIVQDLYICRKTNCPAVLTENLFQDNQKDVEFLLSEQGKQIITLLHVDAIKDYIKTKNL